MQLAFLHLLLSVDYSAHVKCLTAEIADASYNAFILLIKAIEYDLRQLVLIFNFETVLGQSTSVHAHTTTLAQVLLYLKLVKHLCD